MLKKLVSLFLVIFLMSSLFAGCTKKEASAPAGNSETADTTTAKDEPEKKEVQTLTMFCEDVNPNYDEFKSPVALKITEATGIKLDMEYPVGDAAEKIGIMIASGEYNDLIMAKGTETTQLVEAGALIDLAPLIEQYAPNLQKLYGKYINRLKYSVDDPAIYSLSSAPVDTINWKPGNGFELQHAVVKELGYPKMETLQDYENAIKAYIEKYPTIDGQPTVGLSLCTDDWRWYITLGNPAGFATGAPDDGQWYIDPATNEATYRFILPEEKEYFRWLNHMNDIGLLDPDSFVQKYDAYTAKIASGRVLGLIDAWWEYKTGEDSLKDEGKFERTYGSYPIQLDPTKTKYADFRNTGYLGGYGVSISTNCKDPVAAIKFLDWMASDEGQVLRNWGIEGVNYTVDADGKRVISPEEWEKRNNDSNNYIRETGIGNYVYPFPSWGPGKEDPTGNFYSTETTDSIKGKYTEIENEVLAGYGVEMWKDLYPTREELNESAWGAAWMISIPEDSGISVTIQKCDDITRQGLVEAIIASPDKFDAVYDKMIADLKAEGVEDMNAKFTELVKAQIQKWQ